MKKNILKLGLITLLGAGLLVACDKGGTSSSSVADPDSSSLTDSTSSVGGTSETSGTSGTSATSASSATSVSSATSASSVTSVSSATSQQPTTSSATTSIVVDTTNYGTEAAPLTVEQVLEIANVQCASNNAVTKQIVYAKGIVTTQADYSGSYIKTFYIADEKDSETPLMVYSCNKNTNVANPDTNDEVVIAGYVKNYNGTIEFATANSVNVSLLANVRGTSTISTQGEHFTANLSAESGVNGSNFTFTVEADEGYKVDSVKVNGNVVEADEEGTYTGTIHGDMVIYVETSEKGSVQPVLVGTLSFANTSKRTSQDGESQVWEDTWDAGKVIFTNAKGASTNAVVDSSNPIRCYAHSNIKIEFPSMVKVVVKCNSATYANNLNGTTFAEGLTHIVVEKEVTITFEATDAIEINDLSAQVRIDAIEVYTMPTEA